MSLPSSIASATWRSGWGTSDRSRSFGSRGLLRVISRSENSCRRGSQKKGVWNGGCFVIGNDRTDPLVELLQLPVALALSSGQSSRRDPAARPGQLRQSRRRSTGRLSDTPLVIMGLLGVSSTELSAANCEPVAYNLQ